MEDLIEDEACVVTITDAGYIKRLPTDTYRVQKRGGKGVSGGKLKDGEDFVTQYVCRSDPRLFIILYQCGSCAVVEGL